MKIEVKMGKYIKRGVVLSQKGCVRSKGGQTAILIHWSTAQQTTKTIVGQRQRTTGIELPLFHCSEFWPIFKNILNRRNYKIMGLILILRNSELRHAVDHSENSGSGIAELQTSDSTL